MDRTLFEHFKELSEAGLRGQAGIILKAFIDSFVDFEDKAEWTRWYLEEAFDRWRIRHELYAQVVFPVLLEGYHARDPWCLLWLARTRHNLAGGLWEQVECASPVAMLKEAFAASPHDEHVRRELLANLMEGFQYCIHQWPAGILYGYNGATLEECGELLTELELAKRFDAKNEHAAFLQDVAAKVAQYKQRLTGAGGTNDE